MSDLLILLPLYDDWAAAGQLLDQIRAERVRAEVLIVNDGSREPRPDQPAFRSDDFLSPIRILHLKRNMGHQRAIATGLVYAYQNLPCKYILIMDSDGQDRPEDIRLLLNAATPSTVVFASRIRRSESLIFKMFYVAYRILHRLTTGIAVRVGNFSVLPSSALDPLVVSADLWNHYAAAVFRTRFPRVTVPCARGKRSSGESKMDFISLLVHGISALSVFADIISARILCVIGLAILACLAVIGIFGGTTLIAGFILIVLVQLIILALGFCFLIASRRSESTFLPLRDCAYYISRVEQF